MSDNLTVMTLDTLLSDRAKKTPKKISIKYEDRKISFYELNREVDFAAGGLREKGLKKKQRVAILMENCPEYIITYFAVIRAGGIVVPINTFLTPDEISYIINDSDCRILVFSDAFLSRMDNIKDKTGNLKTMRFEEIPRRQGGIPGGKDEKGSDDDTVVLLYTSGTTGFPKGTMLSHRNLVSNAGACRDVMDVTHKDRVLLFLPLFHAFSFTVCVILPVYAGATIVLLRSVKPFSKVIRSIIRDRITLFIAVPTIYNILARKKIPAALKFIFRFLVNIRACISGAAALPEATIHEFGKRFRVPLLEGYGLTETSPVAAVNPLRGAQKVTSVGPPIPGVEAAVVGEDGKRLKTGETGELIIKGPNVMKGYFKREEETNAVLKDGWLYTGDMARIDEDGYIYIVDRKKDLIIVDGMNVYPREVEEYIMNHDSVEECAMVGIPDGKGSEIPLLFLKKREGAVVDELDINRYMKDRIARFKMPRRIIFIDEMPKTATGKIKKTELRKWKL